MPTLAAGESASFSLAAGFRLAVTASSDAQGTITIDRTAEDPEPGFTAFVKTTTFGPYSVHTLVTINISSGSLEYSDEEDAINAAGRMLASRKMGALAYNNTACEVGLSGDLSAPATQITRQVIIRVPDLLAAGAHSVAFRLRGAHTAAVDTIGIWRTTNDIEDQLYNAKTDWQTLKVDAVATITVPAEAAVPIPANVAASGDFAVESSIVTDPFVGVTLGKYLVVRLYALANLNRAQGVIDYDATTLQTHGIVASYKTGVDGVTTPGNFTSVSYNDYAPAVSFIFYTDTPLVSVLYCGGSADQGSSDSVTEAPEDGAGIGAINRALFRSFADGGMPVIFQNACINSGSTSYFLAQLEAYLQTDNHWDEIMTRGTAGDDSDDLDYAAGVLAGTLDGFRPYINRIKGQATRSAALCKKYNKVYRFIINRYRDGVAGAEYAALQEITEWARQQAAKGVFKIDDGPRFFNDETAAVGTYSYPEYQENGTGTHWNGYGQYYRATNLIAEIRAGR